MGTTLLLQESGASDLVRGLVQLAVVLVFVLGPILKSVKEAERRLLDVEDNKAYLGMDGLSEFGVLTRQMLLGEDLSRAVTVQTPGGTGAPVNIRAADPGCSRSPALPAGTR